MFVNVSVWMHLLILRESCPVPACGLDNAKVHRGEVGEDHKNELIVKRLVEREIAPTAVACI